MPRRVYRRRKTMPKTRCRTVKRNKIARQVHKFKRQVFLGSYTASSNSSGTSLIPVARAFTFQLSDLPNVSEYTSLFDQYKINGVSFNVIPKTSEQIQGGTSGTVTALGYGQVVSVIDYDNAPAPSNKNELLEYGSVKTTRSNKIHKRFLRPKMLNVVFRNVLTSGYSPVSAKYIDESYNDIPHYGIRLWIDPPTSVGVADSSITYDIYATYYFTCKNTK